MAHFAKVENDIVTEVLVVANSDCGGGEFPASEPVGQSFLASLGLEGEWLQTSYNSNFRGVYASAGWSYDSVNDVYPRSSRVCCSCNRWGICRNYVFAV
jgi:hypothetical protein